MNNLHRTSAHCPARLKLKNNKIGISSSWLKMTLFYLEFFINNNKLEIAESVDYRGSLLLHTS
ncbi:hypothetical protein BpHYR1_021791 [Brachionus plicatilis]|uniref:Uncharacterized protein n=1 Tax=Brachionus plicatilis TaxID=10195 RepID=A0A3M7RMJ9_BRAPC|nr:hypothetical protein BpHYR1_021791 [Brachionus plicatilis]